MKLRRFLLSASIVSLSALAACNQDKTPNGNPTTDLVEPSFSAGIQSRVTNDSWNRNDAVGISMVKDGALYGDTFNYEYRTVNGGALFTPAAADVIYFPSSGDPVSFRAYYPYKDDLDQTLQYPLDVTSQNDLSAIDFLTAGFAGDEYSKINDVVNLKFHHRLTKLTFQISKDDVVETPLQDFTLTIKGMSTKGTYDIMESSAEPVAVDPTIEDIVVPADARFDNVRTAIVLPRPTAGEGVQFVFTNGTQEYIAEMPEDLALESETAYLLKIVLKQVDAEISAEIIPWIEGGERTLVSVTPGTAITGGTNVENGEQLVVYTGDDGARTELTTFTYSGTGDGKGSWTANPSVYWESIDLPANFYGLIQGDAAPEETNQLDDYIVAKPMTVSTPAGLAFELSHAASMVTIQMRQQASQFALSDFTITLPGYETGGAMDNGVFVPGSDTDKDVTVKVDGNTAKALIQPQTRTAGSTVVRLEYVPVDGVTKTFDLTYDENITFEAGKAYILVIDIDKTPMMISAKVVDWQTGSTVTLAAPSVVVSGQLNNTDEFFENKDIQVYMTVPSFREMSYHFGAVSGSAWEWRTSDPIYWDEIAQGTSLGMTAVYYPFQGLRPGNITAETLAIPWKVDANQSAGYADYDILTSRVDLTSPTYANFIFRHALAKVRVEVTAPEFTDAELQGMGVTLKNFIYQGGVRMTDAVTLSTTTSTSDIIPYPSATETNVYTALVFPGSRNRNETLISITLPGYPNPFQGIYTEQDVLPFVAGEQTTIKVTLRKTEMLLSGHVEPWGDAGEGEIVIQ